MTLERAEKVAVEFMKKRPKVKNVEVKAVLEGAKGRKIVRGIVEGVDENQPFTWTNWQVTVNEDGSVLEWKYSEE